MSQALKTTDKYQKNLMYAVIVALVIGVLFLRPYISLIVVSFIFSYLFGPIYKALQKRFKKNGSAATVTLLIAIISVLIPLIVVIAVTIRQATEMVSNVDSAVNSQGFNDFVQNSLDYYNKTMTNITGNDVHLTVDDIWNKLSEYASTIAQSVLSILQSWVGSLGSMITNIILFIYIFMASLIHKKRIIDIVKMLNPLGDEVSELYLARVGDMTKGMIRGQFIIAICQGVVSAIILTTAGLPYFSFWVLLLSFMSLIPLGAGIITIPLGIQLILMGEYWQGALVIGGHLLVVTNIDNILRPILVPKSVRLNSALIMLAVFSGLAAFGFLGIVVGPIIMILIITTLTIYEKFYKNQLSIVDRSA